MKKQVAQCSVILAAALLLGACSLVPCPHETARKTIDHASIGNQQQSRWGNTKENTIQRQIASADAFEAGTDDPAQKQETVRDVPKTSIEDIAQEKEAAAVPEAAMKDFAPEQQTSQETTNEVDRLRLDIEAFLSTLENSQPNQYYELKQLEEQLDDRLELLEDQYKAYAYRKQTSYQQYHEVKRSLKLLDDKLDHGMDAFAYRYGIDD